MCKVEALSTHLCANPATVNVKHEPAICSVGQVEIPHVLEGALVDLSTARSTYLTAERISTVGDGWHLVHQLERVVE